MVVIRVNYFVIDDKQVVNRFANVNIGLVSSVGRIKTTSPLYHVSWAAHAGLQSAVR